LGFPVPLGSFDPVGRSTVVDCELFILLTSGLDPLISFIDELFVAALTESGEIFTFLSLELPELLLIFILVFSFCDTGVAVPDSRQEEIIMQTTAGKIINRTFAICEQMLISVTIIYPETCSNIN